MGQIEQKDGTHEPNIYKLGPFFNFSFLKK